MKTLRDQAVAVVRREVSPLELLDQALTKLERVQAELNAFTAIMEPSARQAAHELTDADPVGPLHGVPIVIKDLYDIAGVRTTGCTGAYMERPPATEDSAVVAALRGAGAVIVAKTNQHELACGATSQISSFGPVKNPWDPTRIPGGSSGGSGVAVATRITLLGMGSDTGGSIREPSSMCGVTGLKPTHGAVSLRGAMPMIPSLDSGGPLAVDADDCLLVHRIIAGLDPGYLWSRTGTGPSARADVRGLRIGLPRNLFKLVHPEVLAAVEAAARQVESMGATLLEVEGPDPDGGADVWTVRWADVASCYPDIWEDPRISSVQRRLFDIGRAVTGLETAAAQLVYRGIRFAFEEAFRAADVLLAPTTPYPPPRVDDDRVPVEGGAVDVHAGGAVRLTSPVNVAGLPALAIPVGFSSEGLPIGAQLIGPDWSEELLCSIGATYQRETDWHLRVPPAYAGEA